MRKSQKIKIYILGIALLVIPLFIQASPVDTNLTIFQKLVQDSIVHITLEADFDSLFNYKKLTAEQKATLTLVTSDSTTHQLSIKVKTRGVYRRRYCDVPPLRLNFSKEDLDTLGLNNDFDKLKLVTHCMENETAEQVLLREYWTYKLHNSLTPNSFKVHLIKITYINSRNRRDKSEKLAFLIENNDEMANRIGGKLVDRWGTKPSQVKESALHNSMLFNYMIGNLDWHLARQRNIKLVELPNEEKLVIVPYDFDMSALVFPSYARLNPDFKQRKFTDRFCVGRFGSKEAIKQTIAKFEPLKSVYFKNINQCPYLDYKSKLQMKLFLKSFFQPLTKEKTWKKRFL